MPYMPDIRGCVGFIYPNHNDARKDTGFMAAGFFLSVASEKVPGAMYAHFVTNEHAIRGLQRVYVRVNQKGSGFCTIGIPFSWFAFDKSYDIAIARMPADTDFDIQFVAESDLLEDWRGKSKKLRIGQGDDLFMLTRIVGQKTRHKTANLVSMRFGNVSLCPEHEERCFIAEMRSVAGHSGSPVFVYQFLPTYRPNYIDFGYRLLGINRGHLPQYEEVLPVSEALRGRVNTRNPTHVVATNMSLCQVVPAWKIKELLHGKKLHRIYERLENRAAPDVAEDAKLSIFQMSGRVQ